MGPDLAPVLAQPLERSFPDGTRVRFAPGTPVLRATRGLLAFMPTAVVPVADAPMLPYATCHLGRARSSSPPRAGATASSLRLWRGFQVHTAAR